MTVRALLRSPPFALVAALALGACARQLNDGEIRARFASAEPSSATASSAAPRAESAMHPPPFTADQIRDATKPGRTYRFRVESDGRPTAERVIQFTKVDADGAEISTNGEPAERVRWEDLRKHGEFPRSAVSLREEKVTVPAGTFDCVVYVVQGPPGEVQTFFFAKELPGAPVLFFTEKDHRRVMTSTLVEHRAGK